jgi:hypothetical protein
MHFVKRWADDRRVVCVKRHEGRRILTVDGVGYTGE